MGFPLFESRDSGFYSQISERFGIESMRRRWEAKNNLRDYGIARSFGSGLKNPIADPPNQAQQITQSLDKHFLVNFLQLH